MINPFPPPIHIPSISINHKTTTTQHITPHHPHFCRKADKMMRLSCRKAVKNAYFCCRKTDNYNVQNKTVCAAGKFVLNMNDIIANKDYISFFNEIKQRIQQTQYEAMKAVNTEIIALYWEIGRSIAGKQANGWGKSLVEQLAADLQREFPGIKGFGSRNIWYMVQFYTEYQSDTNLLPLVAEISWAKYISILTKCKNSQERQFYILATKKFGWSKNVLIHHIASKAYEKYLLGQTNFDTTLPDKIRNQAALAVKDDYFVGYGELDNSHSEHELEQCIIDNIRPFLAEFGSDVMFAGNQYRLELDGREYFVDLMLYHRKYSAS